MASQGRKSSRTGGRPTSFDCIYTSKRNRCKNLDIDILYSPVLQSMKINCQKNDHEYENWKIKSCEKKLVYGIME